MWIKSLLVYNKPDSPSRPEIATRKNTYIYPCVQRFPFRFWMLLDKLGAFFWEKLSYWCLIQYILNLMYCLPAVLKLIHGVLSKENAFCFFMCSHCNIWWYDSSDSSWLFVYHLDPFFGLKASYSVYARYPIIAFSHFNASLLLLLCVHILNPIDCPSIVFRCVQSYIKQKVKKGWTGQELSSEMLLHFFPISNLVYLYVIHFLHIELVLLHWTIFPLDTHPS